MKPWIITVVSVLVICLLLGALSYAEFGSFNFIRVGLALSNTLGGEGVYPIADKPEKVFLVGTRDGLENFRAYLAEEGYTLRLDEQMGALIPVEREGVRDYVHWSANAMYHKFTWESRGEAAREPAPTEPVTLYFPETVAGSAYFYPESDGQITVRAEESLTLTCTYPSLTVEGSHRRLYWEGQDQTGFPMSQGFCVAGADTAAFLEDALQKLGLEPEERQDFIVQFLPRMQENPWNLISFREYSALTCSPEPDTRIRVFMAWKPLDASLDIEPQTLTAPERTGFTVVEWAGGQVNEK